MGKTMAFDYLAAFPIPAHVMPPRLRGLLEPISLSSSQLVEVASLEESAPHGDQPEHLHMLMAEFRSTCQRNRTQNMFEHNVLALERRAPIQKYTQPLCCHVNLIPERNVPPKPIYSTGMS